jgi:hypothetical protein
LKFINLLIKKSIKKKHRRRIIKNSSCTLFLQ